MFQENRTNELVILKEIAETLNTSNDTYHVLQAVLEKIAECNRFNDRMDISCG